MCTIVVHCFTFLCIFAIVIIHQQKINDMKNFEIKITWNDGSKSVFNEEFNSASDAENWASYYVGSLGTYEII